MAADMRRARLKRLAEKGTEKYGEKAAIVGKAGFSTVYYPSGSTSVDYMLGTGGLPGNAFTEVFGPPGIGKSTIFGYAALSSVQQAGGVTAMIATEPDVDEEWMAKHGVDPELNIVYRPDTGEEAFGILRDLIYERDVDYILFDSLGGVSSAKEQKSDVPQSFGNANLNSWGIRNVAVRAWKNNVGVMFVNQVRDDTNSPIKGTVKSPGGWTVEHFMKIRIQLKPGKQRYMIKVKSMEGGNEDLLVGREIRANIVKNKAAQELGKKAVFEFFHIETDEYGLGFKRGQELVNTASVAGVFQGTGWINHEVFPGGKINGKAKAAEFLDSNDEAYNRIYNEVMDVARAQSARLAAATKKKADEQKSA